MIWDFWSCGLCPHEQSKSHRWNTGSWYFISALCKPSSGTHYLPTFLSHSSSFSDHLWPPFTSALHLSLYNVILWACFRGAPSGLGNSGSSSLFIGPKTQRFRSSGSFPLSLFIFWLSWNLKAGTFTSRYQACWHSIPNLKGRSGKQVLTFILALLQNPLWDQNCPFQRHILSLTPG